MDDALDLVVTAADVGQRLDRFLVLRAQRGGRTQVKAWLEDGRVTVDGHVLRKGNMLRLGQRVRVSADVHVHALAVDALRPLSVVYADAHLVVVDKPAGLPTHGHDARDLNTLTAQLVARYPEMRGIGYRETEPGIVHRLDTDTSGLLLAARTTESFQALKTALKQNQIDKRYVALCAGQLSAPQVFDGFLVSDRSARVKVSPVAVARSRPARTEVVEARLLGAYTLVTIAASHAGRHQIRAHLAHAGCPLVGDHLYGGPSVPDLKRHFLHASSLQLAHPMTRVPLTFHAPLAPELTRVLDTL